MIAIVRINLVRLVRDRSNIFFVVVFPIVLILVLGIAFGSGGKPRLGVSGDGFLIGALESARGFEVRRYDDAGDLRSDVERGRLTGGLVISGGGLEYVSRREPQGQQLGVAVRAVVSEAAIPLRAAEYAGVTPDRARSISVPGLRIEESTTGTARIPVAVTGFDVAASEQLLLFVFLTSLTGASELIETRRLGISRRMYAAPLSSGRILLGEGAGRVAVALAQGLVIMAGSALLFGVHWGDPLGAAALLLAFSLVGGGAAMLLGSVLRSGQQATALGLLLSLGLAALGGAMLPLDLFSEPMRRLAHVTPHAWALDGFAELLRHGGTVADVLPQLGVLLAFAAVLFGLGSWRLAAALTR
ncbi:ABC transporter permease [Nonomuraea sediminis]|uniref:ABC transporter permease n=1 Tax=Nonomuraea sediminis TaxID=2835864 RepID=UPI001BDC5619|nr:ABC transporter permease [Nonomuraea sediminis]